jgi:hypothetical protein
MAKLFRFPHFYLRPSLSTWVAAGPRFGNAGTLMKAMFGMISSNMKFRFTYILARSIYTQFRDLIVKTRRFFARFRS